MVNTVSHIIVLFWFGFQSSPNVDTGCYSGNNRTWWIWEYINCVVVYLIYILCETLECKFKVFYSTW